LDETTRLGLRAEVAAIIREVAGGAADAEAGQIVERALEAPGAGAAALALDLARKRAQGAPLGLATGRQAFLGVTLEAREDVLAPREETELLGRSALAVLSGLAAQDPGRELRMIDMGCGSGNLTCALAVAVPQLHVWASDLTPSCAELTRANAARLGLGDRVQVSCGDLFEPLRGLGLEAGMELVVMNPPYIPTGSLEKTHARLLEHEPRAAFDGGPYGISIVTRLLHDAPAFLKPGGHLLFEFGLGQEKLIQRLAERQAGYQGIRFATDGQGAPRVGILHT
jgi:release factor glutamine methyltransferase